MKACVLSAPAQVATQPLKLRDLPSPGLAAGEVRIAVAACAICRTDLHVVEGELPTRRSPMIPGHQVVGRVTELGADVAGLSLGQRVGVAWLHRTCGTCRFCRAGRENLCESADFTGWTVDGGFATEIKAPAAFTYPLPDDLSDLAAAPLLCAGIIGYRALKLTGIDAWAGARLGLYGFGAAGHIAI
ncbi:MAG: alcohol dehydrogenase catalytic domain-containing protein, partial [Polyangia bacterium]